MVMKEPPKANAEKTVLAAQERPIRPLTEQLILAAHLDIWPGNAAIVDFGIDSDRHLGALQFAIRNELVTAHELDAAMGSGAKLTEIAQRGDNPYGDAVFRTSWDDLCIKPDVGMSAGNPASDNERFTEILSGVNTGNHHDQFRMDATQRALSRMQGKDPEHEL